MEEAKDIHTSLRKASGIMKFVQDTLLPQVIMNDQICIHNLVPI